MVERCVRDAEVAGSNPVASIYWPVGQAVKTTASHAVNPGSIPGRVTKAVNRKVGCFFVFMHDVFPTQKAKNLSIKEDSSLFYFIVPIYQF